MTARVGKSLSGCAIGTMRFTRRQNVESELIKRLHDACNVWEEEYPQGTIPIDIVRGILKRYDEVSHLKQMYLNYGE